MSNHWGSQILNEVLKIMEKRGIFEQIGREPTRQLVLDIMKMSRRNDCNPGEILDEIGERVGVCYVCGLPKEKFREDVCMDCRSAGGWDEFDDAESIQRNE
jgi:hypothetical protein